MIVYQKDYPSELDPLDSEMNAYKTPIYAIQRHHYPRNRPPEIGEKLSVFNNCLGLFRMRFMKMIIWIKSLALNRQKYNVDSKVHQ